MKIPNLKLVVFSLLWLKSITAYPEGYHSGWGGRERAMANASATLIGPFAMFNNQAFLSGTTAFQIGIEYAQPWMISNYRVATGAAVFPLPGIVAGLSLSQNAIPGFNETRYGFALAKALGRRFSAGMQFSYFTIGFPESGKTKGTLIYEAGIGFTPNPNVALGLHLFNPFNSHIEGLSLQNDIPMAIGFGCSFLLGDGLTVATQIDDADGLPVVVRLGLEYLVVKGFFIRGGISARPFRHSAGLGYQRENWSLDFAMIHHESLGYSPSVSFIFKLKK